MKDPPKKISPVWYPADCKNCIWAYSDRCDDCLPWDYHCSQFERIKNLENRNEVAKNEGKTFMS